MNALAIYDMYFVLETFRDIYCTSTLQQLTIIKIIINYHHLDALEI